MAGVHVVVELVFDDSLEGAVRDLWRSIGEGAPGGHPHLSVASYASVEAAGLDWDGVARLVTGRAPVAVSFLSWGAFPTEEGVYFLAPVVTPELLALHRELVALGPEPAAYYRPGAWVPHCTIAIGMLPERLPALAAACRGALPLSGRVEAVALVEYAPRRELAVVSFGEG